MFFSFFTLRNGKSNVSTSPTLPHCHTKGPSRAQLPSRPSSPLDVLTGSNWVPVAAPGQHRGTDRRGVTRRRLRRWAGRAHCQSHSASGKPARALAVWIFARRQPLYVCHALNPSRECDTAAPPPAGWLAGGGGWRLAGQPLAAGWPLAASHGFLPVREKKKGREKVKDILLPTPSCAPPRVP